jgi:hypothetical protein
MRNDNDTLGTLIFFSAYHWPRGKTHEKPSPARKLGSWVRIPLKARIFVCVDSVFVLDSGLATGRSSVQVVLPTVFDYETEVKRSVPRMPYAPSGSNRNRCSPYNKWQRKPQALSDYMLLINSPLKISSTSLHSRIRRTDWRQIECRTGKMWTMRSWRPEKLVCDLSYTYRI